MILVQHIKCGVLGRGDQNSSLRITGHAGRPLEELDLVGVGIAHHSIHQTALLPRLDVIVVGEHFQEPNARLVWRQRPNQGGRVSGGRARRRLLFASPSRKNRRSPKHDQDGRQGKAGVVSSNRVDNVAPPSWRHLPQDAGANRSFVRAFRGHYTSSIDFGSLTLTPSLQNSPGYPASAGVAAAPAAVIGSYFWLPLVRR